MKRREPKKKNKNIAQILLFSCVLNEFELQSRSEIYIYNIPSGCETRARRRGPLGLYKKKSSRVDDIKTR